jgi:hypothetical protein
MRVIRTMCANYANAASTLALLFALAGTATAATVILITGAQVKDGSLTGADIADHSIGLSKFTPTAKARLRGARGPAGPVGPAGSAGAAGAAGKDGAAGTQGPAGTKIQLAGYATTNDQTLPDDTDFHTIWTMSFDVSAGQAFIATGSLGNADTSGCPDGNNALEEQVRLDGSPYAFNGALMIFTPGHHTLSYAVKGTCSTPGYPVHVPAQQAILIPFNLP